MNLPTSKTPAKTSNPRVLVLYSLPKVGKTSSVALLEDTLIVDLERGTRNVESMSVEANSLAEFQQLVAALTEARKSGGQSYKRGVIDTVTRLEEFAEELATTRYKKSPMGKSFEGRSVLELANGAGYLHLRIAMRDMLSWIYPLFDEIILLGHLKDKFIGGKDEKKGQEVASKDLDLTGKIKNIICAEADAIGYMYRKGDKLMVSFKASNDDITAGSRLEKLKGFDGEFDWKTIYN